MRYSAALLVLLAPLAAAAQETEPWGGYGDWRIYIDPGLNNGCFAVLGFEGGGFFRAGIDQTDESAYVMMWRPEWQSLQPGQDYDLNLRFGAQDLTWNGPARADDFPGGGRYLRFGTGDFTLLEDVLNEGRVTISYQGKEITDFDLKDSDQAMLGVLECQDEVDGRG
jgi:hypothetical protein